MPASSPARRSTLLVAAIAGGMMVAMVIEIMLARRGIMLTGAWQGVLRRGGAPIHAALAWWAITGGAFAASFAIAGIASRFSWLYFRSLRLVGAGALALALATVADGAPVSAADAAAQHAVATFAALAVAMLMAGFGAFFAIRH
jgi:hypothetical protein